MNYGEIIIHIELYLPDIVFILIHQTYGSRQRKKKQENLTKLNYD